MGSMSWRNASSLIVIARKTAISRVLNTENVHSNKYDYCCMLLKRSAKSKAFAKSYVFPGGVIDPADVTPLWLDHFSKCGFTEQQLTSQFSTSKLSEIPLYDNVALSQTRCVPEVTCRISAIREAFEETGILFCQSGPHRQGPGSISAAIVGDLPAWQERIHQDPEQFLGLCREKEIYPNVWDLHEWSNWLTPKHLGPKRFDTIFYLCICESLPNVNIDNKEITEVQWLDPLTALHQHFKGVIQLAPPQVYELSRLANIMNLDDLKTFVALRSAKGVQRWLPVGLQSKDGLMTVLPGDSLYPGKGVADESEADVLYDFEHSGTFKNRMHFSRSAFARVSCNITDPNGHLPPLNFDEVTKPSKL